MQAGFQVRRLLYWEVDVRSDAIFLANFGAETFTQLQPNVEWSAEELGRFDRWRREVEVVRVGGGDMRNPEDTSWRAVKEALGGQLPHLMAGGSPCNDLSILNAARKGLEGQQVSSCMALVCPSSSSSHLTAPPSELALLCHAHGA